MQFLDRLAEEKIQRAIARGELDDLPGKGSPIADEVGMDLVAPELRTAYRLLRNAGYVPEEVRLRREIGDVAELLRVAESDTASEASARARLQHLLRSLGESRTGHLMAAECYLIRITGIFSRGNENSVAKSESTIRGDSVAE